MWVAIVNRNRRGDIARGCPVRGETKPAALEKRLIADRASVSALDDENQWKRGSFEPPWRRRVRRSPRFLLIGRRLVSRCAVRFFTRGRSSWSNTPALVSNRQRSRLLSRM